MSSLGPPASHWVCKLNAWIIIGLRPSPAVALKSTAAGDIVTVQADGGRPETRLQRTRTMEKHKRPLEDAKTRCWGDIEGALMRDYHDLEWGTPLHDDRKIFEFLILEGMQAGLSWKLVLDKRENFRRAFRGFDPVKVAAFTAHDVRGLLGDARITRHRPK